MDLNGSIYTKIIVETYDVIMGLCQSIGVVDKAGDIVARVENGKIVVYSLDVFDRPEKKVLYDQPFDVEYAITLIKLLKQTREYLSLPDDVKENSSDYKTAYRLELKKRY